MACVFVDLMDVCACVLLETCLVLSCSLVLKTFQLFFNCEQCLCSECPSSLHSLTISPSSSSPLSHWLSSCITHPVCFPHSSFKHLSNILMSNIIVFVIIQLPLHSCTLFLCIQCGCLPAVADVVTERRRREREREREENGERVATEVLLFLLPVIKDRVRLSE